MRVAGVVGLAVTVLLAAGCGGGSKAPSVASVGATSPSKTTTSASAPLSPQQETAVDDAYAACLNAHGAQARVIPGGGVGLIVTPGTQPRLAEAQKVCRKLLPKGGLPPQTRSQAPQQLTQMLKLAECMRAHGVPNFPDPTSKGLNIGGIDPNSPQFQAAQKTCAQYFPGGAPP